MQVSLFLFQNPRRLNVVRTAVIENVVVDPATKQNKYTIRWILNNKEETVIGDDSIREIKATRGELDVTQLKLGSKCKAKYSADGNWYNAR